MKSAETVKGSVGIVMNFVPIAMPSAAAKNTSVEANTSTMVAAGFTAAVAADPFSGGG
jgi:hypothetical protein